MQMPRLGLAALLTIVSLAACGGDAAGPPAVGTIVEHRVRPSETSGAITGWDDEHYAWIARSTVGRAGRLLVLLPGTGGQPSHAQLVAREAAKEGYRVVGLMYPDDRAVASECPGDTACMSRMRDEIVRGEDRSPHVTVDAGNSIDGRLVALLEWLDAEHADEGWGAYLDGGAPRWSDIAVGGLSQGGGHAAYIGTIREVARVVMFGAPTDGVAGAAVAWTSSSVTPAARYYGFAHARDPFASIGPNWIGLGLGAFGAETLIDDSAPPYGDTHMLRTDRLPATGSYAHAHSSVFADFATPRVGGEPVFAPAWRYMLGSGIVR